MVEAGAGGGGGRGAGRGEVTMEDKDMLCSEVGRLVNDLYYDYTKEGHHTIPPNALIYLDGGYILRKYIWSDDDTFQQICLSVLSIYSSITLVTLMWRLMVMTVPCPQREQNRRGGLQRVQLKMCCSPLI